jgi:hypothetical protein
LATYRSASLDEKARPTRGAMSHPGGFVLLPERDGDDAAGRIDLKIDAMVEIDGCQLATSRW